MCESSAVKRFKQNKEKSTFSPEHWPYKSALVIVAHPDDETLWAGGTILMHPATQWTVCALCRRSDPDRAPKFRRVLKTLGASGNLGDLDDGPEQMPLQPHDIQNAVLAVIGRCCNTDLILTHSIAGEYTRHLRHEEIGNALLALWDAGKIQSRELWAFAYQDAEGRNAVNADTEADLFTVLPRDIWERKHALITEVYGFPPGSFEEKAALREEAFWRMRSVTGHSNRFPNHVTGRVKNKMKQNGSNKRFPPPLSSD